MTNKWQPNWTEEFEKNHWQEAKKEVLPGDDDMTMRIRCCELECVQAFKKFNLSPTETMTALTHLLIGITASTTTDTDEKTAEQAVDKLLTDIVALMKTEIMEARREMRGYHPEKYGDAS